MGNTQQVLFTENFDNLAVGEVSTDPTGTTPGKGGWYVKKSYPNNPAPVEIIPETGRGNVLAIGANINNISQGNGSLLTQKNIHTLWNNRTTGNNILKLEYDVYTVSSSSKLGGHISLASLGQIPIVRNDISNGAVPSPPKAYLSALYYDPASTPVYKNLFLGKNNTPEYDNFSYNTWISVELFIDYKYEAGTVIGGKIYVYVPAFNILRTADFTHNEIIELLEVVGSGTVNLPIIVKYDNIKLTALQTIPSYILSTNEQLAAKFNLYPNPATNVVTITNSENRLVNKIEVYDTTGKLINSQSFNEQTELQLNVENLASGTYMLHLKTNEGTAVKKLVKK